MSTNQAISNVVKVVFLVPRTLTWDKLCALYLQVRSHVPDKTFWSFSDAMQAGINICFDEEERPTKFVDVDVVRDYKQTGHGSATERVVKDNLIDLPGTEHLVKLLNKNNNDGLMKSVPNSLMWLIREFFNVGAEDPSHGRRVKTIDAMWPAVEVYFAACSVDEERVNEMSNPFTLESFKTLCRIAQADTKDVALWTSCYEHMFTAAIKKRAEAKQRATEIVPEVFNVVQTDGRSGIGHFIQSDNTRIASEYLKSHRDVAVLVVRRRSGNVAIFCGGSQSFDDLATELDRVDAGRWYLETRNSSPQLLNGSGTRSVPPTVLSKATLITLIQTHYRHRPRHGRS